MILLVVNFIKLMSKYILDGWRGRMDFSADFTEGFGNGTDMSVKGNWTLLLWAAKNNF